MGHEIRACGLRALRATLYTYRYRSGPVAGPQQENHMLYRRLGSTGLKLSALSFGAWVTFGDQIGRDEARKLTTPLPPSTRPPAPPSLSHPIDAMYIKVQYGIISTKKAFRAPAFSSVLPNQQQPARERT